MKKLRELLRLKFDSKLTHRQIGRALNVSAGTVSYYIQAALAFELTWPLADDLNDDALIKMLEPFAKQLRKKQTNYIIPDWKDVHRERSKKHMTLALLWDDYAKLNIGQAYSYTQYTRLYKAWRKKHKVTMRLDHEPGEKAFIDYAGATIPIYCRKTKKPLFNAQIFIMVLGASNYTFVNATASQSLPDWIDSHARGFEFFGGAPKILVPDNLKSGITDSCQFEPLANPTYADMAQHYSSAIIPARPYTPRDKAKAEGAVLITERWIIARLSKQTFYSLAALNNAISELLTTMNNRQFQKKQGSRYSQFMEIEKSALQPLPKAHYKFAQFKIQMVPLDYHVCIDRHYYSVPYALSREEVLCRYTQTTVEIFYGNQRQASHIRSYEKDKKTTSSEHMPKTHRNYNDWSPQVFLDWAELTGNGVFNVANEIIANKKHPEQCSKIHFGLKKLSKQFGKQRLNQACRRALVLGCIQFKNIESILKNRLDEAPHIQEIERQPTPEHTNLRGAEYYQS